MTRTQAKYRPVLTGQQITHILDLARKDNTRESLQIIGVLAQFEFKILQGAVTAAYKQEIKAPLAEDLGFTEPTVTPDNSAELYESWKKNPAALFVEQLAKVRTYRYLHGLMDKDEEAKYEKEVIGIAGA